MATHKIALPSRQELEGSLRELGAVLSPRSVGELDAYFQQQVREERLLVSPYEGLDHHTCRASRVYATREFRANLEESINKKLKKSYLTSHDLIALAREKFSQATEQNKWLSEREMVCTQLRMTIGVCREIEAVRSFMVAMNKSRNNIYNVELWRSLIEYMYDPKIQAGVNEILQKKQKEMQGEKQKEKKDESDIAGFFRVLSDGASKSKGMISTIVQATKSPRSTLRSEIKDNFEEVIKNLDSAQLGELTQFLERVRLIDISQQYPTFAVLLEILEEKTEKCKEIKQLVDHFDPEQIRIRDDRHSKQKNHFKIPKQDQEKIEGIFTDLKKFMAKYIQLSVIKEYVNADHIKRELCQNQLIQQLSNLANNDDVFEALQTQPEIKKFLPDSDLSKADYRKRVPALLEQEEFREYFLAFLDHPKFSQRKKEALNVASHAEQEFETLYVDSEKIKQITKAGDGGVPDLNFFQQKEDKGTTLRKSTTRQMLARPSEAIAALVSPRSKRGGETENEQQDKPSQKGVEPKGADLALEKEKKEKKENSPG